MTHIFKKKIISKLSIANFVETWRGNESIQDIPILILKYSILVAGKNTKKEDDILVV